MYNAIKTPEHKIDLSSWDLSGKSMLVSEKKLGQLKGVFQDEESFKAMDQEQIIYKVQAIQPVEEGTEGGLFFGNSTIMPGKVGSEYFMTRGHFHEIENRAEYYWGITGNGIMIFMDREGITWAENMFPGSLHYIDGYIAHRVANVGETPLTFGACWPSDAGHNYDEIDEKGFTSRLIEKDGKPVLIHQSQ